MAADQVNPFGSGFFQQFPDGLGIELAQVGAQQANFPAAAKIAAANRQDFLAGGIIKGLKIKAQLLYPAIQAGACNAGQGGVHTVGRGAAHKAYHQPGGLFPKGYKRMLHFVSSFKRKW